ncbi:hypothetical protein FF1_025736 [Malus domestica]
MSRRLHQAVDNISQQRGTKRLFEDFIEDFLDESDFMDYFKATWHPRIGMWISALQNLPLASQEIYAAMEFYHNQLKLRLLNEKKPSMYKRVDWLIVIEGTRAKVIEELNQENAYVVWNLGSQFGICNCRWAEMGNLCEHILKVINVCRKGSSTPSISLLQYHKALNDMLHCPPHDSLIHDQAVSLAVD